MVLAENLGDRTDIVDGSETNGKEEKLEDWMKRPIVWRKFIGLSLVYIYFIYSITYLPYMKWQTIVWLLAVYHFGGFGQTAGAHRLWTHRSYKATLPLRIVLMLGYSSIGPLKYNLFTWIRNHRVHHKYTDTDLDPHNAKLGFLYSHLGWFVVEPTPACQRALRTTNMQDIFDDPVVMFEKRRHVPLVMLMTFIIPITVPMWFWQESFSVSFYATMFRWGWITNSAWSVNSFAHMWGWRPFNKRIMAAENIIVSFFALGEGWHNFHHMFPWDYKTSEGGFMNSTMHLINLFQRLGLAYDLKTASPELVKNVILKYGDGSHASSGDKIREVPEEALKDPTILDSLPNPQFNKHQ